MRKSILLLFLGISFCFSQYGCESKKESIHVATPEDVAVAEPEVVVEPPKLPAPPGEPGPFLIRLENNLPTQIFSGAASEDYVAFALQTDVRDETQCPATGLQVCFRGYGVITERKNPNTPRLVPLYEADTQSGTRVDDVVAAGSSFVFALNEGRYVGDEHEASLLIANASGDMTQSVRLSQPDFLVTKTTLNHWNGQNVLVCTSFEPANGHPGIQCQSFNPISNQFSPAGTITAQSPVRSFDVAVSGEKALIVWVENGYAKAAYLDKPAEILELGAAVAMSPYIAAGISDFAVSWLGDDAQIRIDRIPVSGSMKNLERKTMTLNGLNYQNIGGIVPLSEGFLISFRHQNTPQLALIDTDFNGWYLLENNQSWRALFEYGVFDIQDAHTGKLLWQTAESFVVHK